MQSLTRLTFLVLAVLLLSGCGGQSPATATTPTSSVTTVAEESTATPGTTATPTTTPTPAPPTATATTSATAAPAHTTTAEQPTIAEPPPGLLLALENSAGGWGLWLVEEGGDLRQLVEEIAEPTYRPDFHVAPDGRQMLYAYQGDIWRLDVASGKVENVTQTEERLESAPRWLPGDTERFVAGSFPLAEAGPSAGYLTLIGFDGSYDVLDEEGSMTAPPAPSPDGKTIAYSKGQPFLYHLEGPETGGRPIVLTSFGLDWVDKAGEASWSPDGSRLAWTMLGTPEASHQATLLALDLATGDHQVLMTYTPAGIGGMPPAPLWGPDGDWLVASPLTFEPETSGLWLAESEGELRRLTTQAPRLSHTPNPALSPDGRRLAFSTGAFDAVVLVRVGEWEPVFWEPPQRVAAVGWASAPGEGTERTERLRTTVDSDSRTRNRV